MRIASGRIGNSFISTNVVILSCLIAHQLLRCDRLKYKMKQKIPNSWNNSKIKYKNGRARQNRHL